MDFRSPDFAGAAEEYGERRRGTGERNVSHKVAVVNRGAGFNLTRGINSLPRLPRPPTPVPAYKFGKAWLALEIV